MSTVAVVGLGGMGSRIARRLLDAGHDVLVWNRTREKAAELVEAGAREVDSPAEAARRAEAVLTMLAGPEALEAVTDGPDGLAAGAGDVTAIEMSTVGPRAVERLRSALPPETGLLDAPVLGSLGEVEAGSLTVFVGGPDGLVERWTPLLSTLGKPLHAGPLGAGAAAKLVVNSTLLGALTLLGEAIALGRGLGLSLETTFDVLAVSALAGQAERRRPAIESGEYPKRFSLTLGRKDADLIAEAAAQTGVELRLAAAARAWLTEAEQAGCGERDYAEVLAWILGSR
jgi:3-hydroxyisobutyrate dehydrogenase-like beta-hydroxyacid dehydrogenase